MTPESKPKAELGLTDFDGGLLGGESEVGALSFGTYWFARGVYEITLHPRPASLRLRRTVETDHPQDGGGSHSTLLSFQNPFGRVSTIERCSDIIYSPRRRLDFMARSASRLSSFALAPRRVVGPRALRVFGTVDGVHPHFAVDNLRPAVDERRFAQPECLDFGTSERETTLVCVLDVIIVTGFPVRRNDLFAFFAWHVAPPLPFSGGLQPSSLQRGQTRR